MQAGCLWNGVMKVECVNPEGYKDKYCEELRQRGTHWFGDGRGVDIHSYHDQEMPCLVWLDGRIRDDKEGGKAGSGTRF